MNKITLMIIVLWVSVIIYCVLPHDKLPPISLPKGAQHNTIGELPFVEVMDDGDFYEEDGAEDWSHYDSCVGAVTSQCKENVGCIEDVKKACKQKNGVPKCGDLEKIGLKYFETPALFFTCDIEFQAVFPDKNSPLIKEALDNYEESLEEYHGSLDRWHNALERFMRALF